MPFSIYFDVPEEISNSRFLANTMRFMMDVAMMGQSMLDAAKRRLIRRYFSYTAECLFLPLLGTCIIVWQQTIIASLFFSMPQLLIFTGRFKTVSLLHYESADIFITDIYASIKLVLLIAASFKALLSRLMRHYFLVFAHEPSALFAPLHYALAISAGDLFILMKYSLFFISS